MDEDTKTMEEICQVQNSQSDRISLLKNQQLINPVTLWGTFWKLTRMENIQFGDVDFDKDNPRDINIEPNVLLNSF